MIYRCSNLCPHGNVLRLRRGEGCPACILVEEQPTGAALRDATPHPTQADRWLVDVAVRGYVEPPRFDPRTTPLYRYAHGEHINKRDRRKFK